MKKHHEKKAKGGGIDHQPPSEEETNKKTTEKDMHADEYEGKNRAERVVKEEKKKGGKVHKRKHGGHVSGKEPMHRLDKRARGGAAKSPLSGANTAEMPYMSGHAPSVARGKGDKITAS